MRYFNFLLESWGFYCNSNLLVMSDTGQNRVFIGMLYLGMNISRQLLFQAKKYAQHTKRNKGGLVNAKSLLYLSDIWTNGKILIVADA